jgi:hypothetical protein
MTDIKVMPREFLLDREQLEELVDADGTEVVSTEPWRWGHNTTYKAMIDGVPYLFTIQVHSQDGWQVYGKTKAVRAKCVAKETWVPDK